MDKSYVFLAVLALAASLAFLAGCVGTSREQANESNSSGLGIFGNPDVFFATLSNSERFAVVMNTTNAQGDESQALYICGAGMAQSWGAIGKNVSYMANYVLQGDICIKGVPGENSTTASNADACVAEYSSIPYVMISYGRPASYFSNTSWEISVNMDYVNQSQCGFQPTESTG